jgi:arylsulfatase A-like enzyme
LKPLRRAIAAALLIAACWSSAAPAKAPRDDRPNILFIIADDLGIGDVRYMRDGYYETPNIDRLAAQSVRFGQAYVTAAVCSPSRAALHTGRHQARFGHDFNPGTPEDRIAMALPDGERTVAERLKAAGYRTALIGKWHLDNPRGKSAPLTRGFDRYFGINFGTPHILNFQPGDMKVKVEGERDREDRTQGYTRQGEKVLIDAYKPDILTAEALQFLRDGAADGEPFFLVVAHHTPHVPLEATKAYLDRVKNVADPMHRVYAAMVTALDDSIGKLLDAVDSHPSGRPTMVVLLSDNGCPEYASAACSNAPVSGFKRELREGGLRTPLLIRWPKLRRDGMDFSAPVSSLDAVASMVAAAGLGKQLDGLDGVDLLPLLRGGKAPHERLYWRTGTDFAVREGRWKLVAVDGADGARATFLFDLVADPKESMNVAAQHPDRVRALTEAFERWNAGNTPSRMTGRIHDTRFASSDVKVRY